MRKTHTTQSVVAGKNRQESHPDPEPPWSHAKHGIMNFFIFYGLPHFCDSTDSISNEIQDFWDHNIL